MVLSWCLTGPLDTYHRLTDLLAIYSSCYITVCMTRLKDPPSDWVYVGFTYVNSKVPFVH